MARPPLSLGELIEHWTLVGKETGLVSAKHLDTRPPTPDQVDRYVRSALFQGARLLSGRIRALIGTGDGDDDEDPGLLKLTAIGSFGLPEDLFRDVATRVLKEWRDQAMTESPSHLRDHSPDLQVALLAALLFCRRREVTDDLVNLLISTVHRIGARAERRVTTELVNAFRRVQGKEGLLFRVVDAALSRPDDSVRRVVFPVVGEDNLRSLVAEYKSSGPAYRRTVQTTYRAGLIRLLEVLQFRQRGLPPAGAGSGAAGPPVRDLAAAGLLSRGRDGSVTWRPVG